MLGWMRKNAGSWMIKLLLGGIILVFCFWGVGSYRAKRVNKVAVVNGEVITIDHYNQFYNSIMKELRQRYGNKLNEQMLKILNIRQRALDQVINNTLLFKHATDLGFRVTDQELAESIQNFPVFQINGRFDSRAYESLLNANRLTPETFEASHRESLLIQKITSFVTSGVKVSEPEMQEWLKWANASVKIDYALFNPESYKNIVPTDEEIIAYFDKQKQVYKTDPLLKVRYIYFNPASYKFNITDQEVLNYYNSKIEEFKTEKTVEARHILIKVKSDADSETVEKAKLEILAISEKIKAGEDFAKLAKQYSQGPSKDNGGYLGTFSRETMVKPFTDKAFSMKQGEVSDPVRTSFGWHLIKVEKVNPASTKGLEKVKSDIMKKLIEQKTKDAAYNQAEIVYEDAFEYQDLEQVAKDRNLKLKTTDYFNMQGPKKGIADPKKFASMSFSLPLNEISEIEFLGDGYYLLQPIEKIPEKIPELASVIKKVKSDLIKEQQNEKAKNNAQAFLTNFKQNSGEIKSGKKEPKFLTTSFFKRYDSIPDIGFEREIIETAFNLSQKKPVAETVLQGQKGYYVIKLNQRKEPDSKEIEEQKKQTKERLLEQKKNKIVNALLEELRKKSEIEIEEEFFNSKR